MKCNFLDSNGTCLTTNKYEVCCVPDCPLGRCATYDTGASVREPGLLVMIESYVFQGWSVCTPREKLLAAVAVTE